MDWTRTCSIVLVAIAALFSDETCSSSSSPSSSSSDRPPAPALPQPVQVHQCTVQSRTDECRGSMIDWATFDKCCNKQCVGMRRMYPKPRIYSPVIGAANNSLMFCLCCSDDAINDHHGYFGFWSTVILTLVTVLLTTAAWYFPLSDWAVISSPTPPERALRAQSTPLLYC